MARQKKTVKPAQTAAEYRHQEKTPARPDVGTQPQFKKRAPPKTWRYDSSLSPSLDWDGQNAAREQGEALIREILDAKSLDKAKAAADKLKAICKPFLNWAGKAERLSFDVPTLPLFVHERLSTRAILETLKGHKQDKQLGLFDLFADPQRPIHDQVLRAYEYQDEWVNRMILGDSMVVMNSMLHYESLGGQVQMIYMDPPYGVKFGSNFQPFVRKRDVTHGDDDDMTREPEMVQAYRDTWELGLHSYLTYLRDRLLLSRELLAPSGSIFVQISDENLHHVREVMDEVFGAENFVSLITFAKTTGFSGKTLSSISDYLLWYARDVDRIKYRQLFREKEAGDEGASARLEDFERQVAAGMLSVLDEERDKNGALRKAKVESVRYIESDTALVDRLLGRDIGGKQNILLMNDEAHHAYRIRRDEPDEDEDDLFGEDEEAEDFFKEATVWIEGLDRIHKQRGINFCVDFSATPYYLGRVGRDANRPFPWVVSDFGLIDAIESGLTKIPQLAVRDTTGSAIPGYFNIWNWILPQLTSAERGGKKAAPKPEAILKYAYTPMTMLAGLWEHDLEQRKSDEEDARPPVFILVCKNTQIAKVIYEWLAEDKTPVGIPVSKIESFKNKNGLLNTIRVDSKVVKETDTGESKSDEVRWMRFTLDTVGKTTWPVDTQGRALSPEGFSDLAEKLKRPLHPPGRDVRCIVSVGMLTEGWDCNTVTHIIGLRPFMSQLLCEQVVGRGLRRLRYELNGDGKFGEETAKIFGVPFQIIPFKANPPGTQVEPVRRHHVRALPEKSEFEIRFPRVEGYTQSIRNRVVVDWPNVPGLTIDPMKIPPEVEMKNLLPNNQGRPSLIGPGRVEQVTLNPYRANRRVQELVFDLARALTREALVQRRCEVPAHALFPQMADIVSRYLKEKVKVLPPAELRDLFLAPYYGWVVERLSDSIRPDSSQGEAAELPRYESHRDPGSTGDVDFWTSRDVREVIRSHVNFVVADTKTWEQSATYLIDTHPAVTAFVKNAGLGFAIPYIDNGQMHDYVPDFILRLNGSSGRHLILEIKGFDDREDIKKSAAERWVNAVNADGGFGVWTYAIAKKVSDVPDLISSAAH